MSLVSILTMTQGLGAAETFAFEHAMAHRNYLGQMAPLTRFSVIPYLLDPMIDNPSIAASNWHLNHQQAHNDALTSIPSYYVNPRTGEAWPEGETEVGLFIGTDLRDTDLNNEGQRKWWLFLNHQEHYVANGVTLPASIDPPPQTFPFW
jgi:hypothetical protein